MKQLLFIAILILLSFSVVNAQIYHVAQMNTDQIRALDKQKTVVILTGGILEEHGPHLPSFSDGFSNEWLAQKLAEAIVERPGMSVLLFPTIPLGHGGGNEIGGKYVFPALTRFVVQHCGQSLWIWQLNSESRDFAEFL